MTTRTHLRSAYIASALTLSALALPSFAPLARAADAPAERPEAARGGGGEREMQRFRTALADLSLTDEQRTKIQPLFETARKDLDSLRAAPGSDPQERMTGIAKTLKSLREGVMEALTDEQKKTLAEKMASRDTGAPRNPAAREAGAGRGPAAAGDGPGGRLLAFRAAMEKLDLTSEQKEKIQTLMTESQEKIRAMMEENRKKIQDILTPEQQEKLQTLMRDRAAAGGAPESARPRADSPDTTRPRGDAPKN